MKRLLDGALRVLREMLKGVSPVAPDLKNESARVSRQRQLTSWRRLSGQTDVTFRPQSVAH